MVGAPEWLFLMLTSIMAIGLPVSVVIFWFYKITPEGIEYNVNGSKEEVISELTNKCLKLFTIVSLMIR